VKQRNVLFYNNNNNSSPVRTALSPVKLSMKNKKAEHTVLTVAGAANTANTANTANVVNTSQTVTNSVNSVKESAAAAAGGDSKSRQGNGNNKKGGSPNENAHPNNNNKNKNANSMIHTTPTTKSCRKHKNNITMTTTTTHITTTPMSMYTTTSTSDGAEENQAAGGEVSFRSALEDLERLLAEPSASPSALIGPYTPHTPSTPYNAAAASDSVYDTLKTPPTHCTDSVLDYSPYSSADFEYPARNTSHNNSEIYSYNAAYAEFSSDVKPTSNPLHAEMHTSLVVEELNALLLHTPSGKECSKIGCFDTIECVEDLHVARVLHRVATLLKKLHRHDESIAYLTAARSVYVALHGESSEVVSIMDQELVVTAHASN